MSAAALQEGGEGTEAEVSRPRWLRSGEIRGDPGRSGEIWGDLGRSGEIWGDGLLRRWGCVFLHSDQRSRGHGLRCIQPYSSHCEWLAANVCTARGRIHALIVVRSRDRPRAVRGVLDAAPATLDHIIG